ncbi:MAG: hypothetical protein COA80_13925 [Leeuwenhoekiella sp.]|uniref:DUF7226 domain-containing protein n=1 Tax=Leeuwenhoekiella nanhaiensis TaxID=1655491 RepID=A0A2G1VVT6_9FLAO|nr:hypothetical protein [Leeuwenhoekiella nanhaiensis]PHQ30898.1 hypothetical protein CJ305_01340 [Leeuwenhoekiella nanhaiensis]PHR93066.1 MAG: hypothetical protein COA80_13925 [Leeuwenhoekiella sp.]
MRVPSEEIPQADNLVDVIRTIVAVSQGARTYQQIAGAIEKVERQGRYYRKAAEIIGLIVTPSQNQSILTQLGQVFIQTNPTLTNPILLRGVLNSRIFQRIIPYLEAKGNLGVSRQEFEMFLRGTADLGANTMAPRRISTVISWLVELEIIVIHNSRYILSAQTINQRVDSIQFDNPDEPLLPGTNDLNEYTTVEQRSSSAQETIISYRNSAALERADNAHRHLVNLTSERIRNANALPKFNQLIDLATHINNKDYIFEMKSTTHGNEKSQIRAGLSQLYEYRYLQNKPQAKLVLVLENPLSANEIWRQDYLEQDRDVYLIWDGNNELYGNERTRQDLDFLGLL